MSRAPILALLVLATGACAGRPIFDRAKPAVERMNPSIPPGRFKVLASIAGGDARTDLQISVTVRQRLADSGFTVIRRPGRWENQTDAVRAICAPGQTPPVDGVLFIWYNRLELRDCMTESAAYEIGGSGAAVGITEMTDRLIRWLKRDDAPTASTP